MLCRADLAWTPKHSVQPFFLIFFFLALDVAFVFFLWVDVPFLLSLYLVLRKVEPSLFSSLTPLSRGRYFLHLCVAYSLWFFLTSTTAEPSSLPFVIGAFFMRSSDGRRVSFSPRVFPQSTVYPIASSSSSVVTSLFHVVSSILAVLSRHLLFLCRRYLS